MLITALCLLKGEFCLTFIVQILYSQENLNKARYTIPVNKKNSFFCDYYCFAYIHIKSCL